MSNDPGAGPINIRRGLGSIGPGYGRSSALSVALNDFRFMQISTLLVPKSRFSTCRQAPSVPVGCHRTASSAHSWTHSLKRSSSAQTRSTKTWSQKLWTWRRAKAVIQASQVRPLLLICMYARVSSFFSILDLSLFWQIPPKYGTSTQSHRNSFPPNSAPFPRRGRMLEPCPLVAAFMQQFKSLSVFLAFSPSRSQLLPNC